jgi:L-2-hydroxycarboxylate dehydrogenase (NAD+)
MRAHASRLTVATFVGTVLVLLLTTAAARAMLVKMSPQKMTRVSQRVVVADVWSVAPRHIRPAHGSGWGTIVTVTRLKVTDDVKGTGTRWITLRIPGGAVDGRTRVVEDTPAFYPGERVLLFLDEHGVVGWREGALEVVDGDAGLGYVVGRDAMLRTVELAAKHGIAAIGVSNSSHFGPAGIYARLAVEHDMIGVAMSNVVAKVVAPGGSRPITGNNPLAVAVPSYGAFPFVLDMSLSAAAGGKLLLAAKKGEAIPLDWATDREGHPTDDPAEAFEGFYQALGGFKGLGLSFVVDILCGLVTGGPFGHELTSMYSSDAPTRTGHMMIALDVLRIIPREAMKERMGEFFAGIKAAPMREPGAQMRVPGERAYRTQLERQRDGVPVSPGVLDELAALGRELGLTAALEPRS